MGHHRGEFCTSATKMHLLCENINQEKEETGTNGHNMIQTIRMVYPKSTMKKGDKAKLQKKQGHLSLCFKPEDTRTIGRIRKKNSLYRSKLQGKTVTSQRPTVVTRMGGEKSMMETQLKSGKSQNDCISDTSGAGQLVSRAKWNTRTEGCHSKVTHLTKKRIHACRTLRCRRSAVYGHAERSGRS